MKLSFLSSVVIGLLSCLPIAMQAESATYIGTLGENPITVSGELRDTGTVTGEFHRNDDPQRKFTFTGTGQGDGVVQIRVSSNNKAVGIAELKKIVTKESIVWSGAFSLPDSTILPIKFFRPSEAAASPSENASVTEDSTSAAHSTFKNSLGRNMVWVATLRIWVCETEVTQREFVSLMGDQPSQNVRSGELPVDSVTLSEAMEFCGRLTDQEASSLPDGYVYTLPTDSQWTVFSADASLRDAVTSETSPRSGPAPVKSLGANKFGIYDTRGNVWEWTRTPYVTSLNSAAIRAEFNKLDPNGIVLRGASWHSKGHMLDFEMRGSNRPSKRDPTNGFRVVLAPRE